MRFERRGSSGLSWRGARLGFGVGITRGVAGAPAAYAERGLPRSVRGRNSARASGGDVLSDDLLRASNGRFGPALPLGLLRSVPPVVPDDPAVARRRAPSAGNGLPRRESFAAGELDTRSPSLRGLVRLGSSATLATRDATGGSGAATAGVGTRGLCRWFCNCARFARDDGALGASLGAGDLVPLSVIRAMGEGDRDDVNRPIIAECGATPTRRF